MGLSRSLDQSLQKDLFSGLFQGAPTLTNDGAAHSDPVQSAVPGDAATSAVAESLSGRTIRRIDLLLGESASHTFCPEEGLVMTPPEEGRMLVLTNRRIIAFGLSSGMRQTVLMPVEEVKAVAISAGARSKGTLIQGVLMVGAAVILYILMAYWLTGRIDGPTVPIIRMDLVALIVFLAVLSGVGLLAQVYFSKPYGEVTFQGDGVKVTFPFKGETAESDVFKVVDAAFVARQEMVAKTGLRVSGEGFSGLTTK